MPEDSQHPFEEQIRSAVDVARRCVVLHGIIAAGHGVPREKIVTWLRHNGLWDFVSPEESAFFLAEQPTQQQMINATWRAEALFPLLWSLDLMPDLPGLQKLCDVQLIQQILPPLFEPVAGFISSVHLRDESEIRAANEKIYDIHWQVRDAQLKGKPTQAGNLARMATSGGGSPVESYNSGAIQERHHAFNWLIGYGGQDWDDISTDT